MMGVPDPADIPPTPELAAVSPRPVLVARCENVTEPDGTPCPGRLRYGWGQSDAACDTCGGRCGIAVVVIEGRVEPSGDTGQARPTIAERARAMGIKPRADADDEIALVTGQRLSLPEPSGVTGQAREPQAVYPQVWCDDASGPHGIGGTCVLGPGHLHRDGLGGEWPVDPSGDTAPGVDPPAERWESVLPLATSPVCVAVTDPNGDARCIKRDHPDHGAPGADTAAPTPSDSESSVRRPHDADDGMTDAVRRQFAHAAASHTVDRRDWTRQQWIDDARKLFGDLDGSVLDLLNGHVLALFDEVDRLRALAAAREDNARRLLADRDRCTRTIRDLQRENELLAAGSIGGTMAAAPDREIADDEPEIAEGVATNPDREALEQALADAVDRLSEHKARFPEPTNWPTALGLRAAVLRRALESELLEAARRLEEYDRAALARRAEGSG